MAYVYTGLVSFAVAMLAFILQAEIRENHRLRKEREEEQAKKETALENGVRQLLSVRLEEIYDRYADSENIPLRVYTRWMKLHKAYKGLNGNGTFDHMKEEMEKKHITNN